MFFLVDYVGLHVNVQEGLKKRTMIILVSSSMESVGVVRMPGIACTVSLVIVKWSRMMIVLSRHALNSATNQKYALEDNMLFMSTPSRNVSTFSKNRFFWALNLLERMQPEKWEGEKPGRRSILAPNLF